MNVIITGASKGLGKAIAEKFAADQNHLVVCARNADQLAMMMEEIKARFTGCTIAGKAVDVADRKQLDGFAQWIIKEGWVPGVLVNNAGQFYPGSVYNEEEGALEKTMAVNLYSAYHLTRALLPGMMQARKGHIFNMCSIASHHAYANGGSYSISKFALLGFSKNLREEMKPFGIKVTAISPGATLTPSWEGAGVDPKRIMEAADVADMIYAASQLSPMAVVEDIILRPQLGDL